MSDELNTEFMITGASFPKDLLEQMVKTDFLFMNFPTLSHLYFQTLHA